MKLLAMLALLISAPALAGNAHLTIPEPSRDIPVYVSYPDDCEEPCKGILWSHGARGCYDCYGPIEDYLVSQGWVYIGLNHRDAYGPGQGFEFWNLRPGEVSHVLSNFSLIESVIGKDLDESGFCAGGHSFGAQTAFMLGNVYGSRRIGWRWEEQDLSDGRFQCYVVLSGPGYNRVIKENPNAFRDTAPPILNILGTNDPIRNSQPGSWVQRKDVHEESPPAGGLRRMIVIKDAFHNFGACETSNPGGYNYPPDPEACEIVQDSIEIYMDAFLGDGDIFDYDCSWVPLGRIEECDAK